MDCTKPKLQSKNRNHDLKLKPRSGTQSAKSDLISTEVDPPPREKRLGRNDAHLVVTDRDLLTTAVDGLRTQAVLARYGLPAASAGGRWSEPFAPAHRPNAGAS
jgi:hypothetical protein